MAAVEAPVLPQTQKCVMPGADKEMTVVDGQPISDCPPGYVIIKTKAVALNPVDTKMFGDFVTPGLTYGMDCAGVVVKLGEGVTSRKIGDRVASSGRGMDKVRPYGGAFCEYSLLIADLCIALPDDMSFEDGATLGTAVASASLTVFWSLGIDPELMDKPTDKPETVLVYGGSTATATTIIQAIKACGHNVIATCSPKNNDFVKSHGADACFDYNSPTCAEDIRKYTRNTLSKAIDCITNEASLKICYGAIGRAGGKYVALEPFNPAIATRKTIKPDWILALEFGGQGCTWPEPFFREPNPDFTKFSIPMFAKFQKLLDDGKFKTHPIKIHDGGFEELLEGVGKLRRKEVSAQKLIYRINY